MSVNFDSDVVEALDDIVDGKIEDFSFRFPKNSDFSQGAIGDILQVVLVNKKHNGKHSLIIKQEKNEDSVPSRYTITAFENEAHFYRKIVCEFQNIYEKKVGKLLDLFPRCLYTTTEKTYRIILEDLTAQGFKPYKKSLFVDNEHYSKIFEIYAIFHGMSMVLRKQSEGAYKKLITPFKVTFEGTFAKAQIHAKILKGIARSIQRYFDPGTEKHLIKRIILYEKEGDDRVYKSFQDGNFHVILHGDCWSNNLMFKYDEMGKVQKVKLLDFQQICSGSPVLDLSYCLYSGASKEILDNLDNYMKLYHDSLTDTLKQFDLDVEDIYPFEIFKDEWRNLCIFGFSMAVNVWRIKFKDDNVTLQFEANEDEEVVAPTPIRRDKEADYKEIIRNLVIHMYENDFL